MEKITHKSESGMVWFIDEEGRRLEPCEMDSHHCRLAIEKLAEYEELGFNPEQVGYLAGFFKEKTSAKEIESNIRIFGMFAELGKYRRMISEGKLIPMPCAVGDTVYGVENGNPPVPLVVDSVGVYLEGADGGDWERLSNFGKTVVLEVGEE